MLSPQLLRRLKLLLSRLCLRFVAVLAMTRKRNPHPHRQLPRPWLLLLKNQQNQLKRLSWSPS